MDRGVAMHRSLRNALISLATAALLGACAGLSADRRAAAAAGHHAYALEGRGKPTVVFQSGLGDGAGVWERVYAQTGKTTAALAYDRYGYGGSSAAEGARDPCSIAREQREFLRAAGVAPPYLLVGHSLGGLYQYVYARLYPEDVAGLVLLDPTHPEHWRRMQGEAPGMAATLRGMRLLFDTAMRREFDDQSACLDRLPAANGTHPPVRLLVRSNFPLTERGGFEAMVRALQRDWQRLTGADRIEQVAGSGHYIQRERPEAVSAAVEDLVRQFRAARAQRRMRRDGQRAGKG